MFYFVDKWEGHPEDSVRAVKRGTEKGLTSCVMLWHKMFAKRHFYESAYDKYGTPRRTPKYQGKKRRQKGHNRPMEYSGKSKREILRYIRVIVRVLRDGLKKATGDVFPPPYFWMYPDKLRTPGHRRGHELFAILDPERDAMSAAMKAEIDKEVKAANRIKRTERIE